MSRSQELQDADEHGLAGTVITRGVEGFCAECERPEKLVLTPDRDKAICEDCAEEQGIPTGSSAQITYGDLRTYVCGCQNEELAVIGSYEEQVDLCFECFEQAQRDALFVLDAPQKPEHYSPRVPSHFDSLLDPDA